MDCSHAPPAHPAPPAPLLLEFSRQELELVTIPFYRGSSWSRDQNQVSCMAGRFFTVWANREALLVYLNIIYEVESQNEGGDKKIFIIIL